ncbi:hypothetical protein ACIRBX_33565 [Kitasatospora sp. NPDC096147]|uniref:hypothetical protein n=1 Tax=Kitasatospora sp. NPDC096147 TaxID=3364093 RepID=UPI003830B7B2
MRKRPSGAPKPYVLWQEVLPAYLMPTVMAGTAGLLSDQPELAVAAPTTIGLSSAVVAALLTVRLHRRPVRPHRAPRLPAALVVGLGAAVVGLVVGFGVSQLLGLVPALDGNPWPGRLPGDFAISSLIAGTIATFRWRGSRAAQAKAKAEAEVGAGVGVEASRSGEQGGSRSTVRAEEAAERLEGQLS